MVPMPRTAIRSAISRSPYRPNQWRLRPHVLGALRRATSGDSEEKPTLRHAKQDYCFSSKALPRQPGGFEGLLLVAVDLDPHDLSTAQRVDHSLLKLRRGPATFS